MSETEKSASENEFVFNGVSVNATRFRCYMYIIQYNIILFVKNLKHSRYFHSTHIQRLRRLRNFWYWIRRCKGIWFFVTIIYYIIILFTRTCITGDKIQLREIHILFLACIRMHLQQCNQIGDVTVTRNFDVISHNGW